MKTELISLSLTQPTHTRLRGLHYASVDRRYRTNVLKLAAMLVCYNAACDVKGKDKSAFIMFLIYVRKKTKVGNNRAQNHL